MSDRFIYSSAMLSTLVFFAVFFAFVSDDLGMARFGSMTVGLVVFGLGCLSSVGVWKARSIPSEESDDD